MTEVNQPLDLRNMFYPKCPFNNSVVLLVLRLGVIALGTVGISFLNIWIAVVYLVFSFGFFFLVSPVKHCQYCYYKVKKPTIDSETGKTSQTLLPKDEWVESCLQTHVVNAKRWFSGYYLIVLIPIILIVISFFLDFSIFALFSLIGFIAALAGILAYTRWKICPNCAFMEECHAAF
ncbi:MAG: hypothetical protein ACXACI_16405 [Candidatus Hodarchaeales archaeon]|jgi:hypothetical protein